MSDTQRCFHCGQAVPEGVHYSVEIDQVAQPMCCAGCEAVAQAIVANNLTDFYRFRTENAATPQALVPDALRELQVYDNAQLQKTFVRHVDQPDKTQTNKTADIREASLILEGIVCAACVWLNEQHVQAMTGVMHFKINYTTQRASLTWDNQQLQLSDVLKAISDLGYYAHPFDPNRLESVQKKEKSAALRRIAIAGLGMMQVMMLSLALYVGEVSDMSETMQQFIRWISLIIATVVVFFAANVFFVSAWRDLRRRHFGMDVPVALAMGAAYSASIWATVTQTGEIYFDSVIMFSFFLLTGRYLEMTARHRAGQVAEALVRLMPATAHRIREGKQETIAVSELEKDDIVLIKSGETIPADGYVVAGESHVNESLLTGESLPLAKKSGSKLVGGTVNMDSPLQMRVDHVGESTVLSAIIRLLERAQQEKPHLAKLADRIASWFVVGLLLVASSVFAYWSFHQAEEAFWITLSVLVVTCPCALSLATPTALTVATSVLTEKGILTTRGHALETLSKLTHVIFDKTGTLTHGRLHVVDVQMVESQNQDQLFALVNALEQGSNHPIAKALQLATADTAGDPPKIHDLTAVSGKGVQAFVDGECYRLGTLNYIAELCGDITQQPSANTGHATQTTAQATVVYLASSSGLLATFYLQDELREEAQVTIKRLQQAGIEVHLLSGDQQNVVDHVAEKLMISTAKGGLLPDDKLQHIQQLQAQGHCVAMIGDGVNDAPVLAAANVSLAMGRGSQLAQASADMVLLSENLQHIPLALQTAKNMQGIIRQNFAWAIGYNFTAIPLAAAGWIAPWMAAIGMSLSSLLVVLNAGRLKGLMK